jgi:hypothetical protein
VRKDFSHGAAHVQYQGEAVPQRCFQVDGKEPFLFGFCGAVCFAVQIKAALPDGGKFPGRRVFRKRVKRILNKAFFRRAVMDGGLGVNGETEQDRSAGAGGGGQFPVDFKFPAVPGACRHGNSQTAARFFRAGIAFKEILRMNMGVVHLIQYISIASP